MSSIDLSQYEAEVAAAEAEVTRIRAANAELAEEHRGDRAHGAHEILRRGAASLAAARDRLEAARVALKLAETTGSPHGLLAREGFVLGSVAIAIPAGTTSGARVRLIEEALAAELTGAARDVGVVLAAPAERYTRERPGRDAEGRTVLDVCGHVEGDVLMPAISRNAKNARRS